jgi:hypothetical protein
MAHDGANKKPTPTTETDKCAKILLRGMIWNFNIHKLNVALVNQVEFRDSKVFTMIVQSFTRREKQKLEMISIFNAEIQKTRKLLVDIQKRDGRNDHQSSIEIDAEKFFDISAARDLGESSLLAAHAVSLMLKRGDCDTFLASAFLLHRIIANLVPLSQRRLPLISFDSGYEDVLVRFLSHFSIISRHILKDPKWDKAMERQGSDIMDMVDGRLFRAVIQAMCKNLVRGKLSETGIQDWSSILQVVKNLSGQDLSLDGSIEPEFSGSTPPMEDHDVVSEELSVLPFSSRVFDSHLKCIHVNTDAAIGNEKGALKIYRETTHWHNFRKPLNVKVPTAQVVSKWRYVSICMLSVTTANTTQQPTPNKPVLHERDDGICCQSNRRDRQGLGTGNYHRWPEASG